MKTIAVILTVFNRKEITLKGLRSLSKAIDALGEGYSFDVYMTDDGCNDGTGEVVVKEFPKIKIVKGDGTLYWTGGMNKAWQAAIDSNRNYDFYLWYNDDTFLYKVALIVLFDDFYKINKDAIITGGCCDTTSRTITTYGGRIRNKLITPSGSPQRIEYMNGNLVLIPNSVEKAIGILNGYFRHSLGDFDYGLRAQRAGVEVYLSSAYVGTCDRHDCDLKYCDPQIGVVKRLKLLYSPRYDAIRQFGFNLRYLSWITAVGAFVKQNVRAIFALNLK